MTAARRRAPRRLLADGAWEDAEASLARAARAGRTALVALDFDGTLAPIVSRPDRVRVPSATLRSLLTGAAAYFGTYQADYSRGRVVHRIEGEVPPNIGTTEIATPFRLRGDSLQLGGDSTRHWIFIRVRR